MAGTKLKSTTGWTEGNGDGSYGFNVPACGSYGGVSPGMFLGEGTSAWYWTSTEANASLQVARGFNTTAAMNSGNGYKYYYDYVRLVKDA